MIWIKIYYYFNAILRKCIFKLIYNKRLTFGKRTIFRKAFNIAILEKGNIRIGDDCFFNNGCSLNSLGNIEIGSGSIFGEGVKIYDHNHRFSDLKVLIKEQGYTIGEVKIGSHCWIGSNVIFLKGASVGDNCIIGAGCIISCVIPCNSIVKSINTLNVENLIVK
ncbi:MAG: acyltransferase [Eubacteriaceae bacterium]|nr:acyltransferase [Eubacteriaceae bacterium]